MTTSAVAVIKRRSWYVWCRDPRIPRTPMALEEAQDQARRCDEQWPECGPHLVYQGRGARAGYE